MKNNQVTKFLILFVFVFLCSCDLFKSMCEAEKPPKQSTTLQQIVNDTNAGETIDLEKYSNEYDITDYNAEISKNLTIKNGSFQNTTLKIKAEVKLEKVQELSVETSANLTIRDSKLNNLLLGTNAESRSTNSGNTNFDLKVIVKNCEIAEKIKINSKAKLNIAGEKTKIAKIVVAVAAEVCKILCTTEVDTKKIENVITDENGKKPEEIKITQAYKITYHSNCGELEDIEDFFSPDDETISLPTDIFKRNGYIFAGWYYDNNQAVEDSINVSDKTADIHVYAGWTKYIPGSGVYKYELKIEDLVFEWGGGFSVLLLTDEQLEVCNDAKDFKQATAEKPEYQIAAFSDMIVEDTTKEGNFAVYGRDNKSQHYDGVAVTIKDNTFTLFIDMTKLTKTQLKGLWKGTDAGNEPIITEDDTVNLTGYKPYVIALTTQDKDVNNFKFRAWDADLMEMTAGATFPTNLQQSAPTTGNTNEVKELTATADTVAATINGLSAGTYTLKVTGEITNNTIADIKNAMRNSESWINLDLSGTTGLTEIDDEAFYNCLFLISIIIPDNITSIGKSAFAFCQHLADFNIPQKVITIEENAFIGCPNLTNFEVDTNNSNFSSSSDNNSILLNKDKTVLIAYPSATGDITIPDGVTSIGQYTFYECSSLTSVTIPNSVTTIGDYAFCDCSSLTRITIPNSVTSIGDSAFSYCSSLTSVTIPNNVTTIGVSAFSYCKNLTSIEIPNSVTTIGVSAFSYCENLTSVTFKDTNGWYYNDDSGNKITIDVTTDTAQNATKLKDTYSEYYWYKPTELAATADSVESTIASLSAGAYTLKVTGEITSTTITTIATAMNNNTEAKINLDLSEANGATTIDIKTFYECSSLTRITIPNSVTFIGDSAFSWCTNLTNVTISDSVTTIGDNAFSSCLKLTNVTIPDSVISIGSYVFSDCSSLTSVTFNNTSGWYYTNNSDFTGGEEIVVTDPVQNAENLKDTYSGYYWYRPTELTATADNVESTITGLSTGTYTLKVTGAITNDTITTIATAMNNNTKAKINLDLSGTTELNEIPENAFYIDNTLNDNLISIIIPDSVTSIGEYAFRNCNITSVTIGSGVTSIGSGAFTICSKLKEVIISNNIKIQEIKDHAFSNCYNLTGFTIPSCLASIGNGAFNYCSNLTKFEVDTSNPNYSSSDDGTILFNKNKTELIAYPSATGDITIPDGVKSIGEYAFANCSSLTSIEIPDGITSIGTYAFRYCSNLTNVTIPDSVTTIGVSAFYYCENLTSVIIGSSVTTIDAEAFSFCSGLTSIEIPNSVTTIGDYAFSDCSSLTSVTFEDTTSTWYYTDSENYTGGQTISVTNATENATYLKETYYDKYWYKSSTGGTAN